ncbi:MULTISPECIES: outer membrane protein assembly factor BamC [unclassified Simplicispira]|uniref:outer membrane protein assembly factor BamC n=1 Tax=unclassified Simplicispira TaxID=2630407 RepID=UPI000D5D507F|nr:MULTISPECIES: outer membrane protein assembly factor BamC [unclassified Simplicispira]MBH1978325.1 outer membrane protein assembly factor BamC [Comamonadaceae bacterium]PVY55367.1 Beta-barrel assembly machine subunit BamC [Simplicispira sp. 125]REG16310.1 Beta-barrel assembly machine subunit BamC [Simplicispira sp. 110]
MNQTARLGLLGLTIALSACSVLEGEKIDYKSASKGSSLEVPPDLTQLSRETRYAVPGGVVSANALQAGQATQPSGPQTALAQMGDVRIERNGDQRWLVINRPADKLWEPVREFWLENGFTLALDQSKLGIMETDWAENRAKIPQDIIRSTLGKVLDSLYSTGERDKFRTRMERAADGSTEIYVSHRGMVEVFNSATKDSTVWQPRAADPELETEFLRRMMVKLGVSKEQAAAVATASAQRPPAARVATVGDVPVVQIDEGFDRAWRRVGLALDRTGFTVEDRDRSQGVYFVRYVAPKDDKKEKGFLGKLFSSEKTVPPLKYRIVVRSQGEATTVSVLNAAGAPETSANASSIVRVLADDLK